MIVRLLFERGAFDTVATRMTSVALAYYSLGLVGIGVATLLQRVYFAMQDTKTPMVIGVITVAVNIVLTSISATLSAILLFIFLKRKMGAIGTTRIIKSFLKVCVASGIMGVAVYYVYNFCSRVFYGTTILNALALIISVSFGALIYLSICYALKIEEVRVITSKFVRMAVSKIKMYFNN